MKKLQLLIGVSQSEFIKGMWNIPECPR